MKEILNQSKLEIIKESKDHVEINDITDTMEFIDQKFMESEVLKATENIKNFIRDEIKNAVRSKSFNQGGSDVFESGIDSKNKIINVLENHVLFLEEEIRRKNNTIDSLVQGLTNQTSLSYCQNSKNLPSCNPQKGETNQHHQKITLRPSKSRKERTESINCQTNEQLDTQRDISHAKTNSDEKSEKGKKTKIKRENVFICGDSLVNGIDGMEFRLKISVPL